MKSFVENFEDRRICIDSLKSILEYQYQRECLIELALENNEINNGLITKEDHKWFTFSKLIEEDVINNFSLSIKNKDYSFYILLTNEKSTIQYITKSIEKEKKPI